MLTLLIKTSVHGRIKTSTITNAAQSTDILNQMDSDSRMLLINIINIIIYFISIDMGIKLRTINKK